MKHCKDVLVDIDNFSHQFKSNYNIIVITSKADQNDSVVVSYLVLDN